MTATVNNSTTARGRAAESRAAEWLRGRGLDLVARNARTAGGELDLVMREDETLVFVEVRSRFRQSHGGALASIDVRKCRRLVRAARGWIAAHPDDARRPMRFDIVAFESEHGEPHWLRAAFDVTDVGDG